MSQIDKIWVHTPLEVSEKIANEKEILKAQDFCFSEIDSDIRIPNLNAKITTHRVVLYHPKNTAFNFEWHYSQISQHVIEKRGWFSKYPYEIKMTMNSGHKYKIKKNDRTEIEKFSK